MSANINALRKNLFTRHKSSAESSTISDIKFFNERHSIQLILQHFLLLTTSSYFFEVIASYFCPTLARDRGVGVAGRVWGKERGRAKKRRHRLYFAMRH